jgi:DNA-binding NtrC family response regulator
MPEMTGVKLAEELSLARPDMRVLYMTGYAGAALSQAQSALRNPEERVIQKPFTSDALLDRVRAALIAPATAQS